MVVTLDPRNQLTSTSSVIIELPQTRRWINDISTSNTLPVSTLMTCTSRSPLVSSSIICSGDLSFFTITASNFLSSGTTAVFSFGVSSFLSPPTLEPSDQMTITSYEGGFQVDQCSVFVSGLIAKPFNSLNISPIGGSMVVNSQVGLQFSIQLSDYVNQVDQCQITFPAGFAITFVNVTGSLSFDSASINGQVLTITQKLHVTRLYNSSTPFIINFYNFTAPPSTKVTDPIEVTITRNGYAKMTGSTPVQASANTISGTVVPSVTTVAANTNY